MSNYYQNGIIQIPKVTGNIVITITAVESATSYTNVLPTAIDTDGTIYNGVGYADGYRTNSSGGVATLVGSTATGFIAAQVGDVVRFKGIKFNSDETGSSSSSCYFHEISSEFTSLLYRRADTQSITKNGDVYEYTVQRSGTAYVRFNGIGTGADLIVTINEEID